MEQMLEDRVEDQEEAVPEETVVLPDFKQSGYQSFDAKRPST
jgi:hypothetical protein